VEGAPLSAESRTAETPGTTPLGVDAGSRTPNFHPSPKPRLPYDGGDQGLFTLPYIDAEVWIEFEGGGLE
jgi:hypothetical protein